jgi:hypothetical protein
MRQDEKVRVSEIIG